MTDITNEKPLRTKDVLEAALNKLAERLTEIDSNMPDDVIGCASIQKIIEDVNLAAIYAGDGAIITACQILMGRNDE